MLSNKTILKTRLDEQKLESESILLLETPEGQSIPIQVNRSRRARRLSLRIVKGNPVATLPLRLSRSISLLKEFILSHTRWIVKALSFQKTLPPEPIPSPCQPGSSVLFHGKWQTFSFRSLSKKRSGYGDYTLGESLTLTLPIDLKDYRLAVEEALKNEARRQIPPLLENLARRMNIEYNRLTLRSQKSKWGSCSQKRNISINWKIIHAPLWVQEYLLIHELSHLKQMNHSAKFWAVVSPWCPRYKEARKWFNEHPL